MDQQFVGEHLLPGQLGHLCVILSFVASLFSMLTYFMAARNEGLPGEQGWKKLGRIGFIIHALAVTGIFVSLYYIISQHLFEYHYAWQHSSRGLATKYLLSCFWEGSEGSFLLWLIWHALLGLIILFKSGIWENRVMSVVSLVQAILGTMLLGIYLSAEVKIGSTPFSLLRNSMEAPIFSQPNYLEFIKDGNGLNILLQNYWMVIHPPILFLGFALTLIPFAYAIAALWKGEYKSWIKPAIRWSLVAGAVLGTGIMMGGAWAYESLNFGGYWAWDPVENASLVPWLTLIAGIHTLLIYKSTGRSLKVTLVFFIVTFLLIWYSTFLTRTGVLGETSVHAFTGEGKALYWHLLVVIGILMIISLWSLISKWRKMPRVAGEEELDSREFWMLIGSVTLLIASLQIIFYTSLPVWDDVYNKLTGTEIAPPEDPVTFYNNIQVWFAVFVALLTGFGQFFKYKKTGNKGVIWRKLGLLAAISLGLTTLLVLAQKIKQPQYVVFTFSICFTLLGNAYYLFTTQKGKLLKAGGSITHIGFGLMLLGILLSGYKKEVISLDTTGITRNWDFGKETFEENYKESRENVLIFRNTTVPMGEYMVTYMGDSVAQTDPPLTFFKVRYERRHPETNELIEEFILYPEAYINPKGQQGLSANPDAKHYWTHDVFTYITSMSDPEAKTDTSTYRPFTVKKGDSIFLANSYIVFEGISNKITNTDYTLMPGDVAAEAKISAYDVNGKVGESNPVYYIRGNEATTVEDTLRDIGLNIVINKIIPEQDATELGIRQRAQQDDYIVMKALVFPYIRVLWLGLIIMVIGFFISFWHRRNK